MITINNKYDIGDEFFFLKIDNTSWKLNLTIKLFTISEIIYQRPVDIYYELFFHDERPQTDELVIRIDSDIFEGLVNSGESLYQEKEGPSGWGIDKACKWFERKEKQEFDIYFFNNTKDLSEMMQKL